MHANAILRLTQPVSSSVQIAVTGTFQVHNALRRIANAIPAMMHIFRYGMDILSGSSLVAKWPESLYNVAACSQFRRVHGRQHQLTVQAVPGSLSSVANTKPALQCCKSSPISGVTPESPMTAILPFQLAARAGSLMGLSTPQPCKGSLTASAVSTRSARAASQNSCSPRLLSSAAFTGVTKSEFVG